MRIALGPGAQKAVPTQSGEQPTDAATAPDVQQAVKTSKRTKGPKE